MNICVYGASSKSIDEKYIAAGEALGEELAKRGHTLVFGGGAHGMMGAVARGVKKGGGRVIGVAPSFFNVDGVLFDKCDEFIYTETMRERKQIMEDRSDAFIASPGGVGTFEEFFEIVTLKQLGRHSKPVALFNVNGYYNGIRDMFERAVKESFMTEGCLSLFCMTEKVGEVMDYLEGYKDEEVDLTTFKDIWELKEGTVKTNG